MNTLIKVQNKGQVTIPTRIRREAGIEEGDVIEASFERGKVVLTPKVVIDRSKFPAADDEYTPRQRRIVDARLAKSESEIKKGTTFGPFATADDMIASMKGELKKRALAKRTKRSR